MAMLAEPRHKLKWSVDPRNSTWSKDESKFGQKMLEKMGWSKGKGLGAQEQGSTEHIKVQVKNNTLGLGASVSQEDNWIAHQDDFNQLLAELNNNYTQDDPESTYKNRKKTFNLEEKSKISKKRVHYVKFAKGKDLSSRSEDDLSCIFGKRKVKKMQDDAATTDFLAEDSKKVIVPPDQIDGSNTVTSTLTVQEYFAKRMKKLKKTQHCTKVEPGNSPPAMVEKLECLESQTKKKKKRHKHAQDEAGEPTIICTGILDSSRDEVDTQKKKKRKKSKRLDTSNDLIYNESQIGNQKARQCSFETSKEENNDLGEQKSKKRKKSKKSRLECN
ncbi:PREDICTED: PIN2/TERF1-interacting telomerase inhibitor 1 isoform X1 [Thamnophis sirtalis]|uniref:PIN2/TERF1-interacting telomerase inhibitor 1 isoform X1 n=2 Tax=Thamnophis sirtalis TaxID=35019 RepID=A0A6I9YSQ9_9SAUR|nr:PREDICTED: PIN2/TERF1-interacting telomerase inhibitor 1 isoform X1 [Thamnophis sirtalis]